MENLKICTESSSRKPHFALPLHFQTPPVHQKYKEIDVWELSADSILVGDGVKIVTWPF